VDVETKETTSMTAFSLRWGRIVLGGFLAELILIVLVIPVRLAGGSDQAITIIAVAGSYVVFVPVAWWMGRSLARPVLHGALMGAAAAAIYMLLAVAGRYFQPTAPPTPFIYYVAHVLKIAGGATGGWLAQRSASAVPTQARVP
jgi:hypothetical protein